MNPREQRVMAAIAAMAALYFFREIGWNALILFGIGGIIYWIMSHRR